MKFTGRNLKGMGFDFAGYDPNLIKSVAGKTDYDFAMNLNKADRWIAQSIAVIEAYRKILGREVTGGAGGQPAYYWSMLDAGRIDIVGMAKELYASPEYALKGKPAPSTAEINATAGEVHALAPSVPVSNTVLYAGVGIFGVGLLLAFLKGKLGGRKRR